METLESILRFAGSYPVWARIVVVGCLVVAVGTLALAPRGAASQTSPKSSANAPESTAKKERQVFMRIRPLKLFPDRPDAEVQLLVFVNDTEYRHPSVAGVEWMKVGPAMSVKIIELPVASIYQVRFEMRLREGPNGPTRLRAAQRIDHITTLPFSEEYPLYDIDVQIRHAGVSAVVTYEVYSQ